MSKDGKDRLGGMRSPQSKYKSFDAQFNEFKTKSYLDKTHNLEDLEVKRH